MASNKIGRLNEKTIHNDLKIAYSKPGDLFETEVEGYIIDIKSKRTLIEIQTKNFLKIRPKIMKLLENNKVRIVHNIPATKWLIKKDKENNPVSKRKSTKKGNFYNIFDELIYFTEIIRHPNFSLEILLTEEEEIRQDDGRGSWRRKGVSIKDRSLISIKGRKKLTKPVDYLSFLPKDIEEPFSTKSVSDALSISKNISGKMIYFFKKAGFIRCTGKKGNLLLYKIKKVKQ